MSTTTLTSPRTLYAKYFDEYGVVPKPNYFMNYCNKKGTKLRYSDCVQLLQKPPIRLSAAKTTNSSTKSELSDYSEDEEDIDEVAELKYTNEDNRSTHKQSSSTSESSAARSMLLPRVNSNASGFHKLNGSGMKLANTVRVSMDLSGYISPEILIDETIAIKDDNMNIMSHHRDLSELHINKWPLFRDCILFIFYWLCLINGCLNFYTFNLWYFRFVCLLIWICCLIIGALCQMYGKSPPFYPMYRASDSKYIKTFDTTAAQYIDEWNKRKYIAPQRNWTEINDETMDDESSLKMKLFHIEMYGSFCDSKCGFVNIDAQRIENKSVDILEDIKRYKNKLIRLRVFHILRFKDVHSYETFVQMLRDLKKEIITELNADQMFHIEYNVKLEQRLLMNSTHNIEEDKSVWNIWNKCCANRRLSYLWYMCGIGCVYRFYHDCCIKTHVYDCIKEVTL